MASCLLDELTRHYKECIFVLAGRADVISDLSFSNVRVMPRTLSGYIRTLARSSTVVVGGGTIFHDSFRGKYLVSYLMKLAAWVAKLAVARALGRHVFIVGAGIGPLRSMPGKIISFLALGLCNRIGVRDQASLKTIQSLKLGHKAEVGFDISALAQSGFQDRAINHQTEEKYLGISPVPFTPFSIKNSDRTKVYWESLAAVLRERLEKDHKLRVRIFVLSGGGTIEHDDEGVAKMLTDNLALAAPERIELVTYDGCNIWAIVRSIAECRYFIAARYHAAMVAYLAGCYLAVVPYNRKVSDLALQIGLNKRAILSIEQPLEQAEWMEILDGMFRNSKDFLPQLSPESARTQAIMAISRTLPFFNAFGNTG